MSLDVTALSIKVESTGIREASNALGGLSTSASNSEKRITSLTVAMQKLNSVSANSLATLNTHMAALQRQTLLLQGLNSQSAGASMSTAALTAAITALSASLNTLNVNNTRATTAQRTHNEAMREAHALARGLSGSLGALWLTYGNIAGMAVGVAIGASLKGIVTVGKDVEHTLEGIRVKGGETTKSINEMRDSVFKLGEGIYGPQQVASAFETLVLAGLKAEQALVSVNAAMNLAIIGGTTIEKAATTLVSVGTAVGYTAEGFDRVADVIAKTAALSMSSVASLSEAFKSGSSVNKLYGVSLEDIGTNLGVLSNLGIQGSAAGTAMKNFYKELAAGSDKVTATLKQMKLSSASFKDSKGDFLPLLEVVGVLDKGLKNLTASQQKLAIANLTNERGMRLAVQLLGEYNTKTGESSNALIEFRKNVENSYGFAAIGAVAMSLTAKSQIDSMMNTLKTSFAETFTEMQPEIIAFTGRMKGIFSSESFKSAVMSLAQSFANLAVAIADNLPLITKLVIGFTALKLLIASGAIWTSVAAGITAVGAALAAAAAGTLTLTAALGPLAIVLGVVTAAVVLYNNAKADANKHTQMAVDYSKGYLAGLTDEANRLDKVNVKLKEKLSLDDANKAIVRGEAKDKMVELNNKAIVEATLNLEKGIAWTGYTKIAQAKELEKLKLKAKTDLEAVERIEQRILARAKENADIVKANAAANRVSEGGTGTLGTKPNRLAENAVYNKELAEVQGRIDSVKRQLRFAEDDLQSKYKQGLIGEIALIKEKEIAEVNAAKKTIDLLNEKLGKSKGKENKEAVSQEIRNAIKAREEIEIEAAHKSANAQAEYYAKLDKDILKSQTEAFTMRGEFVNAFLASEGAKYDRQSAMLIDNYNRETDFFKKAKIEQAIWALDAAKAAGLQNAEFKEATKVFEELNAEMSNVFKAVKAASDDGDLVAMWDGAMAAQQAYIDNLGKLKAAQAVVANLAATPAQRTVAQEEITKILSQGVHVKTMFKDVGASIASSLEKAFGRGGKALGEMAKVALNYQKQDNHSAKEKMDIYGDLASAASGFFDTQSNGYKKLQAVSQAFHAYELAATLTDNVAKGISAVLNQALGDPYTAFARMATMAAIVAGLGIAISGGGSNGSQAPARQAASGAGSVLGDDTAKSDSIAKSLSILEKNSGLGLAHSNSMVGYLKTVADNISTLASLVVRTTGITSGKVDGVTEGTPSFFKTLFGSTKTSIKDQGLASSATSLADVRAGQFSLKQYADIETSKWWGMSKKTTTQLKDVSAELNTQFSLVVSSLASSVEAAANSLGMAGSGFADRLNSFQIEIEAISAKGLTGEEFEKQLSTVFSKLGDQMAEFGVAGLSQFQKVGEGYFETLARVANDLIQVKDVFAVMGQAFTATGLDAVKVAESLITAAGGLEALTTGTKFFVDNFLTEEERMKPITASVVARLGELGQSELTTIELYKNKVMALDLTNAADHALYVALLELAPAFKTAAEYAEKTVDSNEVLNKQHELDLRLMEATGKTVEATAIRRQDEIDALTKLNPKLGETQAAIYAALDAEDARKKALTEAEAVIKKNNDLYGAQRDKLKELYKAMMPVEVQRQMELDGMDARQKQMQIGIWAMEKYIKAQADLNALNKSLQDEVDKLVKASLPLAEQRKLELVGLDETSKALKLRIFFLQDEAANALKLIEIAKQQRSLDIQLMEALGNASGALAAKRLDELAAMDESLRPTQLAIYAALDAADAQEKYATKLADAKSVLQAAYDAEAGALQSTIDKFKAFSESLKKFRDDLIMGPLSTLSPEQKYLESKRRFESTSAQADLGDANAIGSLQQVSQEFLDASRGYNASTEAYARDFEAVQRGLAQGISASDQQVAAAQAQLAILNAQVGHLIEIKGAVLSVRDALAAYNAVKVGATLVSAAQPLSGASSPIAGAANPFAKYATEAYAKSVYDPSGTSKSEAEFVKNYLDIYRQAGVIDGSHAGGLDYVPKDNYVANLHKGERVQTAARASAQDEGIQELVRISKEQYQRLCELEEHMAASNVQRAAVAEMSEEQMEAQTRKLDDIKRAVKQT